MEIISKTGSGFLISATEAEVSEILRSAQGSVPKNIEIGQKIPAIDYASTITKLKNLPQDYNYRELVRCAAVFSQKIVNLNIAVEKATKTCE